MGEVRVVLLVEDDPSLRNFIERTLKAEGYAVLSAENGAEGLQVAAARDARIHLLIADILMPHIDGFTLRELVKKTHPETNVLYISGSAEESVAVRGGLKETGAPYLLKPFTKATFLRRVEEVLGDT